MARMRTLLVLLPALFVLVPPAPAPRAWAGGGERAQDVLRDTLAGLAAREPERRLAALEALDGLAASDPRAALRALPRLRTILRLRGPRERARAVALLLRLPDPGARALWLERLDPGVERHEEVLAAATAAPRQAVARADLTRDLLGLVRDARTPPARRALALEALGPLPGPAADLLLARARAGEPWVEACGRALGLAQRTPERAVQGLLAIWAGASEVAPRIHAWESLVRVTRRDLPFDLARWRAWWATRKAAAAGGGASDGEGGRYALPTPVHVPHYYGIPIRRPHSQVVFCLDASQSMYGGGIESARRELRKTLMEFPSTHRFEIVVFNERLFPWRERLVRAHPVQKLLALRYLASVEPTSYTNLYDAVETAFGHAGRGARPVAEPARLDAVFLLSDGAPNRGRHRDFKRVVRGIAELSRGDIPVHTIGAGEEVFPLLRAIARETGGRFVDAFE